MRQQLSALLALATSACMGWRVESGPIPTATDRASKRSATIRVLLKSGARVDLIGARVLSDSIVGYSRDGRPDFARRSVAWNDVQSVSTYGRDYAATTLAVLLAGAAILGLIAACASAMSDI